MIEKQFTVIDEAGIHARPAQMLVTAASKFDATINILYEQRVANLKSILGVLSLGIGCHKHFTIRAEGADETKALAHLEEVLIQRGLAKP